MRYEISVAEVGATAGSVELDLMTDMPSCVTESTETRATPTESQPTADKAQWVGTITATAARTITNAGLFDAVTSGNMFVKGDFTGIVLANGDKIEFTISLEMT